MMHFWPGPLTIVLEAGEAVLESVHAGTGKVGLRAPDNPVAHAVLAAAGCPLVLSSANVSGEPPATTAEQALCCLDGRVDIILDGGPCLLGEASTVLDLTVQPPAVLREGSLGIDALAPYIP
jgi:L-threonylcarbamoyladenylate synthase